MVAKRRILITGLHGTLAPYVAKVAESQNYQVIEWPRHLVDPLNIGEANLFLFRMKLDAIVHCATGPEVWAGTLSHFAETNNIPFVYTSSVMVYSDRREGPYGIYDPADSVEEYGLYKMRCEREVRNNGFHSCIIRLGWQIAENSLTGNQMVYHLEKQQAERGYVECSNEWYPACGFIEDTASIIMKCINEKWYGLFHLDGNCKDKYTFAEIVEKLKFKLKRNWDVRIVNNYIHDQRMKDDYLPVIPISTRLER